MSRLDELKKQYPELNLTVFDLMTRMDSSKSYKYLPLLCKLFARRFDPQMIYNNSERNQAVTDLHASLINRSISTNNLSEKQILSLYNISDNFNYDIFTTLKDFIFYMESNQIENKDVTSYSTVDDMRGAITLASLKEFTKEMTNQVVKEYEDETWIAVRPLTFGASAKYGAGTRWCTTYQREKNYFERYWRTGILCYFINKKTGYKFAGFKSLQDREMSFWNAEDSRIDFLDVTIEDYMFSTVKRIFSSQLTNKNLCSDEIQEQVHKECLEEIEPKLRVAEPDQPIEVRVGNLLEEIEEREAENEDFVQGAVRTMSAVPTYTEPTITRG